MPTKFPLKVLFFVVKLVAIYALLLAAWGWGAADPYAGGFRAGGNLAFGSFWSGVSVRFMEQATPKPKMDSDVKLVNVRNNLAGVIGITSYNLCYKPTIVMISLVLATPLPWRRRGWALVWAMMGVHIFLAVRIYLELLNAFYLEEELAVFQLGSFMRWALPGIHAALVGAPASFQIVPIFIWILVSFRRDDFGSFVIARVGRQARRQ